MVRFLSRAALHACAMLALSVPAASAATFHPGSPILPGSQARVHMLPNGLIYYIQRHSTPAHQIQMRLVVRAGSRFEDEDQQGLAHLLEHMAFNGSTHFQHDELVSYLESVGMRFGADLNADTGFDQTVYKLAIPSRHPEDVDKGFTILEDWAHGIAFGAQDLDGQRKVVLEELRLHNSQDEREQKQALPLLLNGTRYPLRFPIGKADAIRQATADQLRRFYHDWYRPDLMAVIVVGDIDPDEAERQIRARFGGLKNPEHERERAAERVRPLPATQGLMVTDRERKVDDVGIHYPAQTVLDPGTYGGWRQREMRGLFAGMMARRLDAMTQQADAPFVGAFSSFDTPTEGQVRYATGGIPGAGGRQAAFAALLQEHKRVRDFGFTQDELDRVRSLRIGAYERAFSEREREDASNIADEYQRAFLDGEEIAGRQAEMELAQVQLPAISLKEMNQFAHDLLSEVTGRVVLLYGAQRKDIDAAPTPAQLLAEFGAADRAPVVAASDKPVTGKLVDKAPPAGAIVAETFDKATGATRLTLSNGLQVVLKPNPAHDSVQIWGERDGGLSLFDERELPSARYAASVVEAMGLKDYTPAELVNILPSGGTRVNFFLADYSDEIRANASSNQDTLESMFQELWVKFQGVRRDEGLYRSYINSQAVWLRNRDATPDARFADTYFDALYGKHPREPRPLTLADLQKVELDASIEAWRRRFSSARGFSFVVAGNFELAKIKPLVATWLATLPMPEVAVGYRDVGLRFARGVVKREVLAGSEPKSMVTLDFTGPVDWSVTEMMNIGALIQVMQMRVTEVLRQKLGLIYAGGVSGEMIWAPDQRFSLVVTLPTGPEKVEPLIQATFAEIERLRTEGPTPAELAKVKAAMRQSRVQLREDNGFWIDLLGTMAHHGVDARDYLRRQDLSDALQAEDVRQAARQFLNTDNYIQLVLNPEPQPPALAKTAAP